jgi:hypothetical protein
MAQRPVIFLAFANDKLDTARYLRNLPKELDGIRRALQKAVQAGLCEVVERANVTIDDILDVFQDPLYQDRVAVFHYGGHADGYQLLLERYQAATLSDLGQPVVAANQVAHGAGLVAFLGRQTSLKLIFFNGCSTQQQALDLVGVGVPIVVGTSQRINDEVATALSVRFYSGLGSGLGIDRAWQEAVDGLKMAQGSQNNPTAVRGMYREEGEEDTGDRFPWEMSVRPGSEIVKLWNLPEAVENPLFGLPEIPASYQLPEMPFMFLQRYERQHAQVFFGRSYYVRDLYNRLTSSTSAPLILLFGQSGVGKSSLLDAGLLPRLEGVCEVCYLRRDRELGLLGTLRQALVGGQPAAEPGETETAAPRSPTPEQAREREALAQLEALAAATEGETQQELLALARRLREKQSVMPARPVAGAFAHLPEHELWQRWEQAAGRPVAIIMDQAEEAYTQPDERHNDEMAEFVAVVAQMFNNPLNRPQGRLILSYRKEYHPEIEELLKVKEVPRERVFLRHLDRKDIVQVVTGLTRTEALRKRYHLQVQEALPGIVADDLLQDKDSSIAPVLQILLTKMWQLTEHNDQREFTVDKYQELDSEGLLLDDFFNQQIQKLAQKNPEVDRSGLALDILYFHTTSLGTSDVCTIVELNERYKHRDDLDQILHTLKELYLLAQYRPGVTGLAHDTLGPLIQKNFINSLRAGQRATRIMQNKIGDFEKDNRIFLDKTDLAIVEAGLLGMHYLSENEKKLVHRSRKKRSWRQFWRYSTLAIFATTFIVIAILGRMNERNAQKARRQADSLQVEKNRTDRALRKVQISDSINQEIAERERSAKQEAKISANRAKAEAERAETSAKLAEAEAKRAKQAQELAVRKQKEAVLNEFGSKNSEQYAEFQKLASAVQGLQTRLNKEEADFLQYLAKAKELAVVSLAQTQPGTRSHLSLTAYQIRATAFQRLAKAIATNEAALQREGQEWVAKEKELRLAMDRVEEERMLLENGPAAAERLRNQARVRPEPKYDDKLEVRAFYRAKRRLDSLLLLPEEAPEIFEALRQALLKDHGSENDQLHLAESWALRTGGQNELYFTDQVGGLYKTFLLNAEQRLPLTSAPVKLFGEPNQELRTLVVAGDQVFGGLRDGSVVRVAKGSRTLLAKHPSVILAMAYAEGSQALFYSQANELYRYGPADPQPQRIFAGQPGTFIRAMQLVGADLLLFADSRGAIYKTTLGGNAPPEVAYQSGQLLAIHAMAWHPARGWLLVGDNRGQVQLFVNATPAVLASQPLPAPIGLPRRHLGIVSALAVSPDGHYLASGSLDGEILLWNADKRTAADLGKASPALHIRNGKKIFSVSFDKTGGYLLFNDEQHLRICPTDPAVFYRLLCQKTKGELSPDDWNRFVGSTIKQKDCPICK